MSAKTQGVFSQFVVGPVQTIRQRDRLLYFPDLESIGGVTPCLARFQALIEDGADLEALQASLPQRPVPELLDEDMAKSSPLLAAAIDRLDAGEWDAAIKALNGAGRELKRLTAELDLVHATILGHMVRGASPPEAERGLQLLKLMWAARYVADVDRLRGAGFEGALEDYLSKYWAVGGPVVGRRLPRSRSAPWPTPAPQADAPPTPSGSPPTSPPGERIAELRTALDELDAARKAQARQDAARPAPLNPSPPRSMAGRSFFERLFGSFDPSPARQDMAVTAHNPVAASHVALSEATMGILAAEAIDVNAMGVEQAADLLHGRLFEAYGEIELAPAYEWAVNLAGTIVEVDNAVWAESGCRPPEILCHCDLLAHLDAKHGASSYVRVLGSGRAYRIDQTRLPYEVGELVHTEPVLGGSKKKTSFRKLDRLEETEETETEHETFEESEATTHDQFSLSNEISKASEQQRQTDLGASLTASYGGTVSVSANFDTSSTSGARQSETAAVSNAREVINKAVKRVRERTETRRTMKRMSETERVDSFGITASSGSYTGFYQAIDKAYSNQLVYVGERMMVRVSMQQPMAYLLYCMATGQAEGVRLAKPTPPSEYVGDLGKLNSFKDITPFNYARWAALYEVEGVKPPPAAVRKGAEVAVDYAQGMKDWMAASMSVTVPPGYECGSVRVTATYSGGNVLEMHGYVGDVYYGFGGGGGNTTVTLTPPIEFDLPISYVGHVREFGMTFVMSCTPTAEATIKWQMSVYDAIMAAYHRKQEAYDAEVQAAMISGGIDIDGRNPLKNRLMVEQELQKFVLGAVYPPLYYRGFDSLKFGAPCVDGVRDLSRIAPEPDFADAHGECAWLTFLTQIFEWKNMVYQFHPYHYGHRSGWAKLRKIEDNDPFFENALSAGQVLIDIPVAPHMTEPFLYFLQTGQIWNGGQMPVFGDPHFVDIATAVRLAETVGDGEVCVNVPPWITKVPTPLVYVTDTPPPNLV